MHTIIPHFFQIISDATALAFKPDGQQVAVATMNGQITFFNPTTGQQMGGIEGRGDLAVGRQDTDLIKPQKAQARLYIYIGLFNKTHNTLFF